MPKTMDKGIWKIPFWQDRKTLFGEDNYEMYIGRVHRLQPNLPELCNIDLTSDKDEEGKMVIYDPLIYVLMGTGLIWVVALVS
jgi:hypothetical protein